MTLVQSRSRFLQGVVAFCLTLALVPSLALAETPYKRVYDTRTRQYVYVPIREDNSVQSKVKTALKNPIVKQAAIGAATGGVAGMFLDKTSVLKGLGIGALVGTSTGLIDTSSTLEDKPLAKTALKGAAIGTGAGAVLGKGAVKGAIVGTAAGAGVHYVKKYLDNRNNRD